MNTSEAVQHLNTSEEIFLSHFFTSTKDDVYAVKDSMPMSLWGFIAGLASRTHLGVRERFLNVFKEAFTPEEYTTFIIDAAEQISTGSGVDISKALTKATVFLKKFAVVYGHNSLKDSCVDRIVVDRASIRAIKILEESSLGAFQEKSTRYVDFSKTVHVDPVLDHLEDDARKKVLAILDDVRRKSKAMYLWMNDKCGTHFYEQLNPSDFASEDARIRTARAKAFDTARYCLLADNPTSMAFTMPSRETERHLAELLAHPNREVQAIAQQALNAAKQINAGLLTHVDKNDYQYSTCDYSDLLPPPSVFTPDKMSYFYGQHVGYPAYRKGCLQKGSEVTSNTWYRGPKDILALLASAVLSNAKTFGRSFSDLHTALLDNPRKCIEIISRRLQTRGKHDDLPKEFAVGQLVFNCLLDYGAYRDIQRHRKGLMLCSELDARYGFSIPDVMYEHGFETILEEYRSFMMQVAEAHAEIRAIDAQASEYCFTLGHNVMFSYICDFRQLIYIVELRSRPHGHMAYRKLAVNMFDAVINNIGDDDLTMSDIACFENLFRVDRTEESDRRQEENKKEMTA